MSDYYQHGFSSAVESNCSIPALCNYLNGVHDDLVLNAKLETSEQEDLLQKIELEIQANNAKKKRIDSNVERINQLIDIREQEIEANDLKRFTTNTNALDHSQHDYFLSYAIGTAILLLLTLYLVLFYSSTGFSVLYDVPVAGNGIFNPAVLSLALNRGGGAVGFVILFPVIFLAVGFATYVALEKYNKSKQKRKKSFLTRCFWNCGYHLSPGCHYRV